MSSSARINLPVIKDSEYDCPFDNEKSSICSESLSSMVIGANRKQAYCSGDNYDNCPIFLARMLRKG